MVRPVHDTRPPSRSVSVDRSSPLESEQPRFDLLPQVTPLHEKGEEAIGLLVDDDKVEEGGFGTPSWKLPMGAVGRTFKSSGSEEIDRDAIRQKRMEKKIRDEKTQVPGTYVVHKHNERRERPVRR